MSKPLSLTGKRWKARTNAARQDIQALASTLYAARDLGDSGMKGAYPDMDRAVTRIQRAVLQKETIGIFGDYDCDGITSSAQLVRFFRRHGRTPVVRLPHRVHDGYGLQKENITWFAEKGVTLLVTVDTGITSVNEVEMANRKGIEVIVTDHHKPHAEIPSAFAILHPMLSPGYPEPHPSGAGVVYELLEALEDGTWNEQDIDSALAMIGIVADLVPLQGTNRLMVQRGLQSLQRLTNCPLADLRDQTGAVTSTDVAFRIAPRINAAGRISDPSIALSALLEGGEALDNLGELNEQRQAWMHELHENAIQSIQQPKHTSLLWVADTKYPQGIIGLIAGRLTEHFGKPSCAVTIEGATCTASLRSPDCYNISEGLSRCSHLLTSYGGHAQAAGCTFRTENAEAIRHSLTQDILEHTTPESLEPSLQIDATLQPNDIRLSFAESLNILEPFGMKNPQPRFLLQNILLENIRLVGTDQSHLSCKIEHCKAIGFGLGSLESYCCEPIDILCRIGIDEWQGRKQPQIFIEDMRITTQEACCIDETS